MGTAEIVQRLAVFTTATATIAALIVYLGSHKIAALAWNGVCPLVILGIGTISIMLTGPTGFTVVGVLFFVIQGLALVVSVIAMLRRSPNAALFWPAWTVNLAGSGGRCNTCLQFTRRSFKA